MNTGSGSRRPLSKVHGNSAISGRLPLICLAALALLGAGLVLASCGGLSLNGLLLNEEMGEFQVSPGSANVPAKGSIDIQGQGGFKPYEYSKASGLGKVDPQTGVYRAPDTVAGREEVEIQVTDYAGGEDTASLTVFPPLQLKLNGQFIAQITVNDTESVDFDADGGVVDAGYAYYQNGVDTGERPADGQWTFPSGQDAGTYLVEVLDDLGNSAMGTVTVVASGGDLAIDPAVAYVVQGGTVDFKGINVEGDASYTADPAVGSFTPPTPDPDTTYTAPVDFEGDVTVTLTDDFDSDSVTATLYVVASEPDPLSISPSSFNDTFKWGDTAVFTAAGGITPYTFWVESDGAAGKIEKIGWNKALYTAPQENGVIWVWLEDQLGNSKRVKVQVKK
jgi:hypothetical protein